MQSEMMQESDAQSIKFNMHSNYDAINPAMNSQIDGQVNYSISQEKWLKLYTLKKSMFTISPQKSDAK